MTSVPPSEPERSLLTRMRLVRTLRDRMSAYDAAYAAAADALDTPLITTDARLLDACRAAGIRATHLSERLTDRHRVARGWRPSARPG